MRSRSQEPNNLKARNSFRYNGLIHRKTVGVEPAADGKGRGGDEAEIGETLPCRPRQLTPSGAGAVAFSVLVLVLLNQNSWAQGVCPGELVPFQASLPVTRAHHLKSGAINRT